MPDDIRRAAMQIVIAEECLAGRAPDPIKGTHLEKEYGCDILVSVPGQSEPDRVEVKGWGEPFIAARGGFTWPQPLEVSQYEAARRAIPFRVEIVANLRKFLQSAGMYERLTVDADYVREHARPSAYEVKLGPLRDQIRRQEQPALTNDQLRSDGVVPSSSADWDTIARFAITYPGWLADRWRPDVELGALEELWKTTGELPEDLDRLRLELFWEQRGYRHRDDEPTEEELPYLRALVAKIGLLAGRP
jgi:hypothetical protein